MKQQGRDSEMSDEIMSDAQMREKIALTVAKEAKGYASVARSFNIHIKQTTTLRELEAFRPFLHRIRVSIADNRFSPFPFEETKLESEAADGEAAQLAYATIVAPFLDLDLDEPVLLTDLIRSIWRCEEDKHYLAFRYLFLLGEADPMVLGPLSCELFNYGMSHIGLHRIALRLMREEGSSLDCIKDTWDAYKRDQEKDLFSDHTPIQLVLGADLKTRITKVVWPDAELDKVLSWAGSPTTPPGGFRLSIKKDGQLAGPLDHPMSEISQDQNQEQASRNINAMLMAMYDMITTPVCDDERDRDDRARNFLKRGVLTIILSEIRKHSKGQRPGPSWLDIYDARNPGGSAK